MAIGPRTLPALLQASGLAETVLSDAPAWLWDVETGRILFANASGIGCFAEKSLSAMVARQFDMRRPGLAELKSIAASLPEDGTARLAMLRFCFGVRTMALACLCRLVRLDEDGTAVAVVATGARPDRRSLETRADIVFGDADLPVMIAREGEVIYANMAGGEPGCLQGSTFDIPSPEGQVQLVIGDNRAGLEQDATDLGTMPERTSEPVPCQGDTVAENGPALEHEPQRFCFRLDPEGRFTKVDPGLIAAVGPNSGNVAGRFWTDVAHTLGVDAHGQVAAAIVRRETWSGIEIDWPRDEGGFARVRLAGHPRFGLGRVLEGFRGYGDVLAVTPAADPVTADGPAAPDADEAGGTTAGESEETASPEAAASHETRNEAAAANVVPLRPGQSVPRATASALNDDERTAFHAIAAALGARAAGDGAIVPPSPEHENEPGCTIQEGVDRKAKAPHDSRAAPSPQAGKPLAKPQEAGDLVAGILDCLPIGIAIIRDECVLHANRTLLGIFGYPDIDALRRAGGLSAVLGERSEEDEGCICGRRQDGTSVRLDSRLGRIAWIDGPAIFLTARELPEEGEPEKGSADEVTELRAILDTASDGVLVLDETGQVVGINRSAEALFEQADDDVIGRPFADLVAPDSRAAVTDYLDGLASGGVMSVLNEGREIVATTRRGGEVPLFLTIGRIGESEPARYCAVMRDMTDWKAAEAELIAARQRAEEASAQKSDFLAQMSHEIRTPLNAIIGFAEVMAEERFGPMANGRYLEYSKDIRRSGEHIISLVNDLLDLSKVEAGKLEMTFAAVDLNDIAERTIAIMQPQATREHVIIRSSLARNLPHIVADARSLRQIMLNLLSNGIKFTPPGGQVIVTTMMSKDGDVVMRVRDTGIGMSESDVETALEPFRQLAVPADKDRQGTGLGLPLTRALVVANRASFAIRSRVDEGTLVEVCFPQFVS